MPVQARPCRKGIFFRRQHDPPPVTPPTLKRGGKGRKGSGHPVLLGTFFRRHRYPANRYWVCRVCVCPAFHEGAKCMCARGWSTCVRCACVPPVLKCVCVCMRMRATRLRMCDVCACVCPWATYPAPTSSVTTRCKKQQESKQTSMQAGTAHHDCVGSCVCIYTYTTTHMWECNVPRHPPLRLLLMFWNSILT